jgi:hypothetical protein
VNERRITHIVEGMASEAALLAKLDVRHGRDTSRRAHMTVLASEVGVANRERARRDERITPLPKPKEEQQAHCRQGDEPRDEITRAP